MSAARRDMREVMRDEIDPAGVVRRAGADTAQNVDAAGRENRVGEVGWVLAKAWVGELEMILVAAEAAEFSQQHRRDPLGRRF